MREEEVKGMGKEWGRGGEGMTEGENGKEREGREMTIGVEVRQRDGEWKGLQITSA